MKDKTQQEGLTSQTNTSIPDPAPTQQDEPKASAMVPIVVKITAGVLNVRKQPNKEAPIVFRLPKDSTVEVIESEKDDIWLHIATADGQVGYVMKVFTAPLGE